jgi:hypothetical protein
VGDRLRHVCRNLSRSQRCLLCALAIVVVSVCSILAVRTSQVAATRGGHPPHAGAAAGAATEASVTAACGRIPLSFEVNKRQADAQVKFLSFGNGCTMFLTGKEAALALGKGTQAAGKLGLDPQAMRPQLKFNGKAEPTTYVNSQLVTASIAAADIAIAGTATVTVTNSGPGGGPSNALPFNITGISVSPNMGTGSTQAFGVSVFDPNGVAEVKTMHLLFNTTSVSQASACRCTTCREQTSCTLGRQWNEITGSPTPGAAATLTNNQCTLNAAGTSVGKSGNTLNLRPS